MRGFLLTVIPDGADANMPKDYSGMTTTPPPNERRIVATLYKQCKCKEFAVLAPRTRLKARGFAVASYNVAVSDDLWRSQFAERPLLEPCIEAELRHACSLLWSQIHGEGVTS